MLARCHCLSFQLVVQVAEGDGSVPTGSGDESVAVDVHRSCGWVRDSSGGVQVSLAKISSV